MCSLLHWGFSHPLIHCPAHDSNNLLFMLQWGIAYFERKCPRRDSNPGQSLSFYSYKTIKDCPSQGDVVRRTIGSFYSRKGFMLDRYTTGAILLAETYCPLFRRKKIFCRTKDLRGYIFS